MNIKILKPVFHGGKYYFEKGEILLVKRYCDRAVYKEKGLTIFLPKDCYKEVSD